MNKTIEKASNIMLYGGWAVVVGILVGSIALGITS